MDPETKKQLQTTPDCTCPYPNPRPEGVHRSCPVHGDVEPWEIEAFDAPRFSAAEEVRRLRRVMAAALERVQVEDCAEAEHILSLEVNLDGTRYQPPVIDNPDAR